MDESMAIMRLLDTGAPVSVIAKRYRKVVGRPYHAKDYPLHKARVEEIKTIYDRVRSTPVEDDDDSGPEPDVGPFRQYLGE
jgi:hypothetical protein